MSTNASTLHLDQTTFDAETREGVAMIDFWAPWCPPCRAVGPIVDAIAEEYQGRAKVAKVNVDESPRIAGKFGVQSIPTIVFLKDGQEVGRVVGLRPREVLAGALEQLLAA
ncbi:MAG TPA: thioredoxin [Phycisphaerales bacterium]|nr:thioredoxin [Phycisphaerales bacterium]